MTPVTALEAHRVALTGHCYRMLGSAVDADDAVQETMLRAWKNLGGFDGRAALRTWLHRIATNVCLDALADRQARVLSPDESPPGTTEDELIARPRTHWLEPITDARAIPADEDPATLVSLRQSIRLAFIAALQHLPPRQRAALLLSDVLGWSAAEIADNLDQSVASVNSSLQRARATLATRDLRTPGSLSGAQSELLDRYVDAFQRYDLDALEALLKDDIAFAMPPFSLWLEGPAAVGRWMLGRGSVCRGSRLVATTACGSPAFAHYHPTPAGGFAPWALIVLDLDGNRIARWTSFLDAEALFSRFGLPLTVPALRRDERKVAWAGYPLLPASPPG